MKNCIILFLGLVIFLGSCINKVPNTQTKTNNKEINDGYSTVSTKNYTGAATEVKDMGFNTPLDVYLKSVAGVNVTGTGSRAKVTIRGVNSFISNTDPLFVVNSMAVDGGFETVYQLVNVNEIKSVSVLKDAASTGIYGVRGANGVVVITLKK